MNINNVVKGVFRRIGVDIRLIRNIKKHERKTYEEKWVAKNSFLRNYNIKTIIDIGANVGQFATLIHKVLPEAKIYTFEPLKDCFYELQGSLKSFPNYKAFNLALGNFNGECEINRSEFSPSSSLLEMLDLHKQNWPQSSINKKETIKIDRLDNVLNNENLVPEIFIKIDVQGYEENVIRGGIKTICMASFVMIEVSFYELYEKQPLFKDIHNILNDIGFIYRGNIEQYSSKIDGRFLFADAIFENINIVRS